MKESSGVYNLIWKKENVGVYDNNKLSKVCSKSRKISKKFNNGQKLQGITIIHYPNYTKVWLGKKPKWWAKSGYIKGKGKQYYGYSYINFNQKHTRDYLLSFIKTNIDRIIKDRIENAN